MCIRQLNTIKYNIKFICLLISFLFSQCAYAIFCPTNFSTVNPGDSLEEVLRVCGPPNSQNTYNKFNIASPQKWEYYVHPNTSDPSDKHTIKMTVVFNNSHVINISLENDNSTSKEMCRAAMLSRNQQVIMQACGNHLFQDQNSVNNTSLCGPLIKVGDSLESVEAACGKPVFTSQTPKNPKNHAGEITELTYNGPPSISLLFEEGRLLDRRFN